MPTRQYKQAALNPVARGANSGNQLKQMLQVFSDPVGGAITRGAIGAAFGAMMAKEDDNPYVNAAGGAMMGVALPHAFRGAANLAKNPTNEGLLTTALGGAAGALTQKEEKRLPGGVFGTTMALALQGLMKRGSAEAEIVERFVLEHGLDKEAGWEQWVNRVGSSKPFAMAAKPFEYMGALAGKGGELGTAARTVAGGAAGVMTADENAGMGEKMQRGLMGGMAGAMLPTMFTDVPAAGRHIRGMVANPAKHMRQAWQGHSPLAGKTGKGGATAFQQDARKALVAEHAAGQKAISEDTPGRLRSWWHGGADKAMEVAKAKHDKKWSHLVSPDGKVRETGQWAADPGKNAIQGIADELSRRGWTGRGTGTYLGGSTKYLPVGAKGMGVGFALPAVGAAYSAAKGETDAADAAADVGSSLGYLSTPATRGLGIVGSMGMASLGGTLARAPIDVARYVRGERATPMELAYGRDTTGRKVLARQAQQGVQHVGNKVDEWQREREMMEAMASPIQNQMRIGNLAQAANASAASRQGTDVGLFGPRG